MNLEPSTRDEPPGLSLEDRTPIVETTTVSSPRPTPITTESIAIALVAIIQSEPTSLSNDENSPTDACLHQRAVENKACQPSQIKEPVIVNAHQ